MSIPAGAHETIRDSFNHQATWCDRLGSPFTATLLRALIAHLHPGAPLEFVLKWQGNPLSDILPLRVAGALHALVLSNQAPSLAALYPPNQPNAALEPTLAETIQRHAGTIASFLISPPQTNEVARSAVLLGGFLEIAAATRLPLRLLEIGASAGLNLFWDQFAYTVAGAPWGNQEAPVHLAPAWAGNPPPLHAPITVASRAGCDIAPVDITDPAQCLRLRAFVWADQTERLARLEGAITLAQSAPPNVTRANAADFLADRLRDPPAGQTTVIYHSIMWNYVARADQEAIGQAVDAAAERATAEAPLAWLTFELADPNEFPVLELTLWPGGEKRRLAQANPHGASVHWLA